MDSNALRDGDERGDRKKLGPEYARVPLNLLGGKTSVVIELPKEMSEKAWKQMMDMLSALKPGYVAEDE